MLFVDATRECAASVDIFKCLSACVCVVGEDGCMINVSSF